MTFEEWTPQSRRWPELVELARTLRQDQWLHGATLSALVALDADSVVGFLAYIVNHRIKLRLGYGVHPQPREIAGEQRPGYYFVKRI